MYMFLNMCIYILFVVVALAYNLNWSASPNGTRRDVWLKLLLAFHVSGMHFAIFVYTG